MIVTQEEYINPSQAYVSYKTLRAFNIFWLGFIIYTGAYVLFTVMESLLFLNKIQLVGLALIFVGTIGLIQFKFESQYLKVLYFLYTGWLIYTISRGFKFDRVFLFENLFSAWYGIMPYFVPVVILFPKNIFYLKRLFGVIVILGMIFLVYSLVYRGQLLYAGRCNKPGYYGNFFKDFKHSLRIFNTYLFISAKMEKAICLFCGYTYFVIGVNKRQKSHNSHEPELFNVFLFYLLICNQNKIYNSCFFFIYN
jgi:hypothetical protein